MSSVFEFDSAIEFLQSRMKARSREWGLITQMAEAIGCQRSHLSRVLKEEVYLTPDQAACLCDFFELSENETEYFMTLVHLSRASHPSLKQKMQRKLTALKRAHQDLATRLQEPSLQDREFARTYYSAWYWGAIHILTSISEYQTLEKICEKLVLSKKKVKHCLQKLESQGFVEKVKSREQEIWRCLPKSLHLPAESELISLHHSNWRERAVMDSTETNTGQIHYTITQSISRRDMEYLKELFLNMIDHYKKTADPSKPEELICFNLDFFKVGE